MSVLQKEIRRSNVDNAVLAADEVLTTSAEVDAHLWERLKIIAVEDIGIGVADGAGAGERLARNYRTAPGGGTLMAIHAVRLLATARKD